MYGTGNYMQNEGMLMLYFFLIQAGPFLRDFPLTWLENVHHFSHLHDNVRFNAIWHEQNVIIFGVMQCDIHNQWSLMTMVLEASRKWRHHHDISDMHGLITLVTLSQHCAVRHHPNCTHDLRSGSQDHHPSTNWVQKTICCNFNI